MEKVTLLADRLWVIRVTSTWPDNPERLPEIRYYETPSTWNKSPMEATIFQNYESGVGHLNMYHTRDRAPKGWFDGRSETLDVVPLYGEILQSPNAIKIDIRGA